MSFRSLANVAALIGDHDMYHHARLSVARLLESGGSLKEAQEAGGWASIQIVADTYGQRPAPEGEASSEKTKETRGFNG